MKLQVGVSRLADNTNPVSSARRPHDFLASFQLQYNSSEPVLFFLHGRGEMSIALIPLRGRPSRGSMKSRHHQTGVLPQGLHSSYVCRWFSQGWLTARDDNPWVQWQTSRGRAVMIYGMTLPHQRNHGQRTVDEPGTWDGVVSQKSRRTPCASIGLTLRARCSLT